MACGLGVVDGDNVIDLQMADANVPSDLGEVLRRSNGDLKALAEMAKKAPASARRPLAGLKYALPVARPRQDHLPRLELSRSRQGRAATDNIPKFPSIFFRVLTSMVPHLQPIVRPKKSIQLDYEAEMVAIIGKRAKHLTMANAVDCIAGYSCSNEGSVREFQRHTTQWGMGKNFDRTGGVRSVDGDRRRTAARRQGPEDHEPPQRQHDAVRQHRPT